MNRIVHATLSCALLGALTLTGCITKPATGKKVPDIARIANLAGNAAEIGTTEYLKLHPDDATYFTASRDALGAMIAAKDYDPASFTAAIKKLPVRALHGTNVSIYVTLGVMVFDQAAQELVQLNNQTWILPVLYAVYNGMSRAMGLPETPVPPQAQYQILEKLAASRDARPAERAILEAAQNAREAMLQAALR